VFFRRDPLWLSVMLAIALSVAIAAGPVTVTPWCDNSARIQIAPPAGIPTPAVTPTGALVDRALIKSCKATSTGNLKITPGGDGEFTATRVDTGAVLFKAKYTFAASTAAQGYVAANLTLTAGDGTEKIYGLGQGEWNEGSTGCGTPRNTQVVVPLARNGQTIGLHQRKFHVTIPFFYSTSGYGFLANMPGNGEVTVGALGTGGTTWTFDADVGIDLWVTTLPTGAAATAAEPIYSQYADATGHAPMLRDDAMIFWQSRNRYMTSKIALEVAQGYAKLDLPVGVLVIDYKNQVHDGDFQPDPQCYPDIKELSDEIKTLINATTVFSFWPEVFSSANEYSDLKSQGCLINPDLGGLAIDPTTTKCRDYIWTNFLKPRYFDKGITAYWLDETDGEGTAGGDGVHGYDTSYGPAAFASNLWVNDWLRMFTEPVAKQGDLPMVLTRGTWAGGQRNGIVLWSSDIESTFEELTAQVPQGVHASMSGIPWWTSDVGGYGCGFSAPQNSSYMQELIVRWYQFGTFCPVFRTHGCRYGHDGGGLEPTDPCVHHTYSCGANEVWSYGSDTQKILEKYIRLRLELKPYIAELAVNVTATGVPTMRPLSFEFPEDPAAFGHNDMYMLGPQYLVAPVTLQNATSKQVYFPRGANWEHFFTKAMHDGGTTATVDAPLDTIPVFRRV